MIKHKVGVKKIIADMKYFKMGALCPLFYASVKVSQVFAGVTVTSCSEHLL